MIAGQSRSTRALISHGQGSDQRPNLRKLAACAGNVQCHVATIVDVQNLAPVRPGNLRGIAHAQSWKVMREIKAIIEPKAEIGTIARVGSEIGVWGCEFVQSVDQ